MLLLRDVTFPVFVGCMLLNASVYAIPKEALITGHIVTGEPAKEGQFKFMVSIRIRSVHYCSGSILNENWILTAAHCYHTVPIETYSVIFGATKLNTGGMEHKVDLFISHEDYDLETLTHDIALIHLSTPVTFTPNIHPVLLPEADIADNEFLIASGWGYTSSPGTTTNDLMYVFLRTVGLSRCQSGNPSRTITRDHLCTFTKKGTGICSGDCGGPLTANGYAYGVASWTRPCSLDGRPDIATRIWTHKKWIENFINDNEL